MKRMLMIVVLLVSIAGADTVYFNKGDVLKNCREVSRAGGYVTVEYLQAGKLIRNNFNLSSIDRIEPGEFEKGKELNEKSDFKAHQKKIEIASKPEIKINYKMLPVSVLCFVETHAYFKLFKRTDDAINLLRSAGLEVPKEMLQDRDRYAVYFFSLVVAGVVNTVFVFENLELQPAESGVQLSYKF